MLPPLSVQHILLNIVVMAPIPQVIDDETKAFIDNLQRRERDLVEFQIPRLRDCKGPLSLQQRLAAELKEDLDALVKQVEILEIRAEDVPRKSERSVIQQLVDEFRESSARIRKDMRAALLYCKKTIDLQAKSNREDLFAGAPPVSDLRNVEDKATDDALMKASNDVTEALRRTIGLMQSELERSVLSHQILGSFSTRSAHFTGLTSLFTYIEESTATLHKTSIQHDVLFAATHASKQLITALERADWLDRLLVLAALAFFFLVVLFVLKQRILDRGIRLAFWWTQFLPGLEGKGSMRVDEKVGRILEEGRASANVVGTSIVSAVRSGTEAVKQAVPTALTQASSVVVNSAGEVLDEASLSSSPGSASGPTSVLDTLSSISTSITTDTTSTILDALPETLSTLPSSFHHAEL
ncbi:Sec20-domain-containing protein [Sanghuangporus baumii]|uniref:Sec20-domain-containing protein n=1 Tax=Sanghuangporus baumii TaxID=108892 RepID=A0A9Q5I1L8_SANBA|nr:Sec20-domain-containing protein [Sanghuangporus baumii]